MRSVKLGLALLVFLAAWGWAAEWFVHHPRQWIGEKYANLPKAVTLPLLWFGNPLADLTDSLGWTGHDAVYEYDVEAPSGSVTFAGTPVRTGYPAPADVRVIDRGEFTVGWSDSLRHPLWVAYHVKRDPTCIYDGKRPNFTRDHSINAAPSPADYAKSGYDRGHMAPNYAMVTRYGEAVQKKTFLMSNIAPQTPSLNRGVWRDVEHRIADLWTARYGEIWVVVGCIPSRNGEKMLSGGDQQSTGIDVPERFYQVILAQEGMDVRALAVIFKRDVPYGAYAARNIISIAELEKLTGLNFNPDMPSFIADPLESDLPSRLWPIRFGDVFKLIALHFPAG